MPKRSNPDNLRPEGVRQRKQREMRRRIAEIGLRLFLADGYEETTLDAIAREAGIARRTFFAYFKSKDEILIEWQRGSWEAICAEVAESPGDQSPLDAIETLFLRHMDQYPSDEMLRIDRLLRSNVALQARKQAGYVEQERTLTEALCQAWPQPERRPALRLVAMIALGAMRIALECWSRDDGKTPVSAHLRSAFACIRSEVGPANGPRPS